MYDNNGNPIFVENANPNNYLIVPEDFSIERAQDFSHNIENIYNAIASIPLPESSTEAYLAELGLIAYNFQPTGPQDLQRNYDGHIWNGDSGTFVDAFRSAASWYLGFVAQQTGVGPTVAIAGGDLARLAARGELVPADDQTSIKAGAAYAQKLDDGGIVSKLRQLIATIFGCPHFTTYDGTHVDFQGAGEFIAARSTQPGNTFQVQMRIEPEGSLDSAVSIITQIAVQVGKDRITFGVPQGTDAPRPQVVLVNGAATTLSATNPVLTLDGGTVTEVSTNEYRVALNTGEVVTVNPFGDGMGLNIALSPTATVGSVQGFLGTVAGQGNDFQLPDGTVLQQPLTQDQLYHQFADAWRVTDANSLFDYGPGQTTATFTNTMFPREILTLADFSPDLVAKAAALAAAAGITDPTIAADAEFDYLSMGGNTNYFTEDATVAALNSTVPTPAVITQHVVPPPSIGILAADPEVTETTGATTPVTFIVNLTSAATTDTLVDYTVVSPTGTASGKSFLTAADFGGTLPSGAVTIAAGQTKASITVDVPNSAIGSAPNKWLVVSTSAPGGNLLYSPTGQAEILGNQTATPTGFNGDQVSVAAYYPDIAPNDPLASGTATVTPDTITFPSLVALTTRAPHLVTANIENPSVGLSGDTISFLYPAFAEGVTFASGDFNGIVLTDPNPHAGNILGATITSTNIIGLTPADLSFTANSVAVNFAGTSLPTDAPGSLQIGVRFANETTSASSFVAHTT